MWMVKGTFLPGPFSILIHKVCFLKIEAPYSKTPNLPLIISNLSSSPAILRECDILLPSPPWLLVHFNDVSGTSEEFSLACY